MAKAGLYWHTLRYLKPVQVYGRLRQRLVRPRPDLSPAPPACQSTGIWSTPIQRAPSLTEPGAFVFLKEPGALAQLGWDGPQREKLWRYNQHYFDDLTAIGAAERHDWHQDILENWLRHNPPASGTGWEPYPTSLRIVNWIKWQLAGNFPNQNCIHSLAVQTRWLCKRLEWHLLGNHLFVNAKALVFSGLAFEGDEANRWLERGLQIIDRELPEQILPDGGNFERSPMYHAIFLEDILDLINASQAWPDRIDTDRIQQWRDYAARMLGWLDGMSHPDGDIALFNDAAIGIAPNVATLKAYADRVLNQSPHLLKNPDNKAINLTHWADTGYIRIATSTAVAFLDVAPVGPDYLPGHAHADTLSFELSLFGQRVIVNGGTSRYGTGPERQQERDTRSHSTVEVDDENSSEVWGGFRVARRAYPFDLFIEETSDSASVSCSHDGYRRLNGSPVHRREWRITPHTLDVNDTITGHCKKAIARFIFHPTVRVEALTTNEWQLNLPTGESALIEIRKGVGKLETARYAPEFGTVLSTLCLSVDLQGKESCVRIRWQADQYPYQSHTDD